jgi:hypothetical protein
MGRGHLMAKETILPYSLKAKSFGGEGNGRCRTPKNGKQAASGCRAYKNQKKALAR